MLNEQTTDRASKSPDRTARAGDETAPPHVLAVRLERAVGRGDPDRIEQLRPLLLKTSAGRAAWASLIGCENTGAGLRATPLCDPRLFQSNPRRPLFDQQGPSARLRRRESGLDMSGGSARPGSQGPVSPGRSSRSLVGGCLRVVLAWFRLMPWQAGGRSHDNPTRPARGGI